MPTDRPRSWERLYIVAAFLGLGGALASALGVFTPASSIVDAVALVNGEPVSQIEYQRAISAMQSGLKRPLTTEDRDKALKLLIDEELMLQHALELGLARDDRLARRDLIQAVIKLATLPSENADPTDEELRKFFTQEKALFASPAIVTVKLATTDQPASAEQFIARIKAGASFDQAVSSLDLSPVDIPDGIPLGKLADYAGGAVRDAVYAMTPGDIAGPIETNATISFVWLIERSGGETKFEAVKTQVQAEWDRRREEEAFDTYVARLRKQAHIKTLIDHGVERDE